MNDHVVQGMMGGARLRQLAKAYLDDAEALSQLSAATADNERKNARISELENKIEEMSQLLNKVFSEQVAAKNAPNPIESYVPGQHDPMERMRQQQQPAGGQSSLDSLPEPKRRGRPPKAAEAA